MKRMLICLILCCLCFYLGARPQENIKEQSDTTIIEKKLNEWSDSLNKRDFSKDTESFKKEVKEFGDKTKKTIEKHTPEVKRMFKSLRNYLKR
jgi:hypothetical protein